MENNKYGLGIVHINGKEYEGFIDVNSVDYALKSGKYMYTMKLRYSGNVTINLLKADYIEYLTPSED